MISAFSAPRFCTVDAGYLAKFVSERADREVIQVCQECN